MRMPGATITRAKLGEQRCYWAMRIHEALRRNGWSAAALAPANWT